MARMFQDVANYVQVCPICQKWKKITEKKSTGILDTVPWVKLSLDIVGRLDQTQENNRYILTIQDLLVNM